MAVERRQLCIVKGKGGMGNRLLCAVNGSLWSAAVGRDCFIDWRDKTYSNDGENSFFHFFDPPRILAEHSGHNGEDVFPPVWRGRLDQSIDSVFHDIDFEAHNQLTAYKKYSIDPRKRNYAQDVVVFWNYMDQLAKSKRVIESSLPQYRGLNYLQTVGRAIREEFVLRPEIEARVDEFVREHAVKGAIGVHVRYTDRKAPVDRILSAVDRLRATVPDAPIFLATDSAEADRIMRDRYGKVITTSKWLPEGALSLHQNSECSDKLANGVEALIDMLILSRCESLVYARRSTFGLVAHCLGASDLRRVIDVDSKDAVIRAKRLVRRVWG